MCELVNKLTPNEMRTAFYRITQSETWASKLAEKAPFATPDDLFAAGLDIWMALPSELQIESMNKRPLLGDTSAVKIDPYCKEEDNMNFVHEVDPAALKLLYDYNVEYNAKFGFICIVVRLSLLRWKRSLGKPFSPLSPPFPQFAKDLTPAQQLHLMKLRVNHNDKSTELRLNVMEDAKITLFRLNRLLLGRDPWTLGQVN